jgi:hypothetical protein
MKRDKKLTTLMPSSNGLCALRKFVERKRISLENGFHVSFRLSIKAYADGVDPTVYPKYGGKIITPEPDSRTIFMEYEDETWRLPKQTTVAPNRVLPTTLANHATLNIFSALIEQQNGNERSDTARNSTQNEKDQRKFELMCRRQKEAAILHESYGKSQSYQSGERPENNRHPYQTPATRPARAHVQRQRRSHLRD